MITRAHLLAVLGVLFGAIVLIAAGPVAAQGPIYPGLYNTGVSTSNSLLPVGAEDPHYALTLSSDTMFPGPADYVVGPGNPVGTSWFPNDAVAEWIAPESLQDNNGSRPGGDSMGPYSYQTKFNIPAGVNTHSVVITGVWGADDWGTNILVNGSATGATAGTLNGARGYLSPHPFTLDNYFVTGQNTLEFDVVNENSGTPVTATGLFVEFDSIQGLSPTPEPGLSTLLASTAIAGSGLLARGRRKYPLLKEIVRLKT